MRIKQCLLALILVVAGVRSISGQTPTVIDFEEFAGYPMPPMCGGALSGGGVDFGGGDPIRDPAVFAPDSTVVFASNNFDQGHSYEGWCEGFIPIGFPQPVSSVSFLLISPPPVPPEPDYPGEAPEPNSFVIYGWDGVHPSPLSLSIGPFVGAQTVALPWPQVQFVDIYVTGSPWHRSFAIDNVSFVSGAGQRQVVASVSGSAPETVEVGGSPLSAHFPLGAEFTFALQDTQGNAIPSSYSLGTASLAASVDADAVFPGLAALQYSNQPEPSSAQFQAVHLGSVPLTITPTGGTTPPVNLTILVEAPASLGTAHTEFDELIGSVSHAKGVLPQYIKAVAHHESVGTFNRNSYRYEPIGPNTGDLDVVSHGQNLRLQAPYKDYRLATSPNYGASDPPLTQGTNIDSGDIDVRNTYYIMRADCSIPGSTAVVHRHIKPCDSFVGADEIYFANHDQNWWTGSKGLLVYDNPLLLNFTAQTGLASSYGLMQVMYVKAVQDLRWQGITDASRGHAAGSKNPSFLFDTDVNEAIGGGSLRLGGKFLAREVRRVITESDSHPLAGEADLRKVFKEALRAYNKWKKYPASVVAFVDQYTPLASRTIF